MRVRPLFIAALAVPLLASCANAPSVAYRVDGAPTSVDDVQKVAAGCRTVAAEPDQVSVSGIIGTQILASMGRKLAADNQLSVTPAEIDAAMAARDVPADLPNADCNESMRGVGFFYAAVDKVGVNEAAKQLRAMDVVVNPRYGMWDAQLLRLMPSGSLSQPAPTIVR